MKKSRSKYVSKMRHTEVDFQKEPEERENTYFRWGRGTECLQDAMDWIDIIQYECIKGIHHAHMLIFFRNLLFHNYENYNLELTVL